MTNVADIMNHGHSEYKQVEIEGQSCILIPTGKHQHFFDGGDLKPDLIAWLDENLTGSYKVEGQHANEDVFIFFDEKDDALLFNLTWCK